jgi:hypothetical protein
MDCGGKDALGMNCRASYRDFSETPKHVTNLGQCGAYMKVFLYSTVGTISVYFLSTVIDRT